MASLKKLHLPTMWSENVPADSSLKFENLNGKHANITLESFEANKKCELTCTQEGKDYVLSYFVPGETKCILGSSPPQLKVDFFNPVTLSCSNGATMTVAGSVDGIRPKELETMLVKKEQIKQQDVSTTPNKKNEQELPKKQESQTEGEVKLSKKQRRRLNIKRAQEEEANAASASGEKKNEEAVTPPAKKQKVEESKPKEKAVTTEMKAEKKKEEEKEDKTMALDEQEQSKQDEQLKPPELKEKQELPKEQESQKEGQVNAKMSKNQKKRLKKRLAKEEAEKAAAAGGEKTNDEEVARPAKKQRVEEQEPKEKAVTIEKKSEQKKEEKQEDSPIGKKKIVGAGVQVQVLRVGSGRVAKLGNRVTVTYDGRLASNGRRFDKGNIGFRLGLGEVIRGWDEGVKGMLVGEKRKLLIPSAAAYGRKGAGKDIPPNSDLVFDVELTKVV